MRYRLSDNGEWTPALSAELEAETRAEARQDFEDKYDWWGLSVAAESKCFTDADWERYHELAEQYRDYEFTEDEHQYYSERLQRESD